MTVYVDDFDRADTAVGSGLGTSPSGLAWSDYGNWHILGGRANPGDNGSIDSPYAVLDIVSGNGNADITLGRDATNAFNTQDCVYFRVKDVNNWWRLRYFYTGVSNVYLERNINGVITQPRVITVGPTSIISLRVRAAGQRIKFWYNNTPSGVPDLLDPTFIGETRHGLGRGHAPSGSQSSIESISIDDVTTPPNPSPVLAPNGGEVIRTSTTVSWTPSSYLDPFVYDVDCTTNGGTTWTPIAVGLTTTSMVWDTTTLSNTTTARVRVRVRSETGLVSAYDESNANFTISNNVAPLAPLLLSPSNGAAIDLAAGFTFSWSFRDTNSGDTQASYAFRRKVSGAAAYEYWNATTLTWGAETFNTTANNFATFPAAQWANGNVYNWSVATRDPAGLTSPYAVDSSVTATTAPTCNVTPVGTGGVVAVSRPVIAWAYADAEGAPQSTYTVKVFSAAQYLAGGFDPATSTATWTSGTVTSTTTRDTQVLTDLIQTSYRAYVQVTGGGQTSVWDFEPFTVLLDPPASPLLYLYNSPDYARIKVVVQGKDNILTFAAGQGDGTPGASVTKTGPDANLFYTYTTTAGSTRDVQFYADLAHFAPGEWLYSVLLSNTSGTSQAITLSLNGQASRAITLPANSTQTFSGSMTTTLASSTFRYFTVSLPASSATKIRNVMLRRNFDGDVSWSRGGLIGTTTGTVEVSDDLATWKTMDVLTLDNNQAGVTYDYAAPPGLPRHYRARTVSDIT